MVFLSYCLKSSPKPLFEPKIRISIQLWIPVQNLSLIGWEIKKLWLSKWCKIQRFKNFIHIQHLFIHIQHMYLYSALIFVQNSTPIFICNRSICSQNYYPFRNYLSIQQLFIHSTFTAHLSYVWKWCTSCSGWTGGSEEVQAIIGTLKRYRPLLHWVKRGKAPPIRTFKTLPDYSLTMFHWFLQIFFSSFKPEKKVKKCCTPSKKLMVSLTLWWARGVPVLLLLVESFHFKLIFSCILALKLDKERAMEGVLTMPSPPLPSPID